MEQKNINSGELRDFVETHNLRNRNSITRFNSLVSIKTAKNHIINQKVEIMIRFDNYGELSFLSGDLDPYLYPTVFEAIYGKMEHKVDHLTIKDNHTRNADIGKYEVKIIPLEKV